MQLKKREIRILRILTHECANTEPSHIPFGGTELAVLYSLVTDVLSHLEKALDYISVIKCALPKKHNLISDVKHPLPLLLIYTHDSNILNCRWTDFSFTYFSSHLWYAKMLRGRLCGYMAFSTAFFI